MPEALYGCVEAGGTKFVCGLIASPDDIRARAVIPTADPASTLSAVSEFFDRACAECEPVRAFGIASFGPVRLDRRAPDWGAILDTPKAGWRGANLAASLVTRYRRPCALDTDVNGAALAEHRWGAARGVRTAAYVTIGTGIGAGLLIDGTPVHGLSHPEMGHILTARAPGDDFPGICPFHGACLEGLASGAAIMQRWGAPLNALPADHPGCEVIAWYLGVFAATLFAVAAPARIIFGGGVMQTPGLLDRVRAQAAERGGRYLFAGHDIAAIIRLPDLGENAGLLGALALAQGA